MTRRQFLKLGGGIAVAGPATALAVAFAYCGFLFGMAYLGFRVTAGF